MSRAAVILGVAVTAILLVMSYPVQAAITCGAVAAAGVISVVVARVVYVLLQPLGQRIVQRLCLRQWSKMPEKDPCPDCGGLGVVDKRGHKYPRTSETLAHVIFAAANSRPCKRCAESGFVTPAAPAEPYIVLPPPPGGWDVTP